MTVAEIRRKNLYKLAERSDKYNENPAETLERAAKAMNSFYRLAGFSERLFYINNDYSLYTFYNKGGRLAEMEKRENEWIKRVNKYLAEFKAKARYNGIYPSITDATREENGCFFDLYLTAWYN